jgi:hypothetical protein
MWAKLISLQDAALTEGKNRYSASQLVLPTPARILDALVDAAAFNDHELESIYSFVSVISHLNHMVEGCCLPVGNETVFKMPMPQQEFIGRCFEACEQLRRDMWNAGGVSAAQEDDPPAAAAIAAQGH